MTCEEMYALFESDLRGYINSQIQQYPTRNMVNGTLRDIRDRYVSGMYKDNLLKMCHEMEQGELPFLKDELEKTGRIR